LKQILSRAVMETARAEFEADGAEVGEGVFGDGAADGFGGEIKDFFDVIFAEGFDGGEENGERFADAGGGFDEEPAAGFDVAIDGDGQRAMAVTVRKRERESGGGFVSAADPALVLAHPVEVFGKDRFEESGEAVVAEGLGEFDGLKGIEFDVGDLDSRGGEAVRLAVKVSIDASLRPMEWVGDEAFGARNGFDFFDQ
jgi:hypothetical protein